MADFLARKDLADFYMKFLLDFLAYGFAHSVNNILSYLNIRNLPILKEEKYLVVEQRILSGLVNRLELLAVGLFLIRKEGKYLVVEQRILSGLVNRLELLAVGLFFKQLLSP